MDVDLMASDAESGGDSCSESMSDPSRLDSDSELGAADDGGAHSGSLHDQVRGRSATGA